MLKKLVVFTMLILINVSAQEKTNIAVLDLSGENITASDAEIISSRLRSELVNTNQFNLIERKKMNALLNEQGIQVSGILSDSSVVQAGRLLGVKQMVTGTAGKIGELYTISIRLVDVESGKILKTRSADNNKGIEALLTYSVKSAARGLAGLEEPADETIEKPGKAVNTAVKKQAAGQRRAKIREELKDAPPEIKQAAIELKAVNQRLLKLKQVKNKTKVQKKNMVRLQNARKKLIEKLKEWEKDRK